MPNIKIKIGAAVDPRIGDQIFQPIVAASKKAKKAIRDGMAEAVAGNGPGGPYRTAANAGGDPQTNIIKQRARDIKAAHREIEQDMRRHSVEQRKVAREMQRMENRDQRIADRGALRVSGGAVRNMGQGLTRGMGVANDLARGAGIDFSLGGALKSRIGLEQQAVDLSNAGLLTKNQGGKGQNLVRQDAGTLMRQVQQTAIGTGNTSEDVMAGLSEFVAKTGDLKTGRDILADMAKLATATGANMADVVSASGDISLALGDVEGKAEKIDAIMRVVGGQSKLGSIEYKDMATQMAKVASRAGQFQGGTGESIASLGAMAQMSKATGGSSTSAQAVTSLGSWINTFSKGARRKEFKNAGVDIENDKGELLNPEDIIRQSLKATGGKNDKLGKLFADVAGQRAIRPWQTVYNKAGGGEAGDKAVHEEFQRMKGADMSKDQVDDQFNAAMKTMARQATIVNEIMKRDLGDALQKAAPDLIKLAQAAATLAPAFAELVSFVAQNPFQALSGLVIGSITKSLGSEAIRAVTEKAVGAMAGQMAVAGASSMRLADTNMSAAGKFASGLAVATIALAAFYAGMQAIDDAFAKKEAQEGAQAVHSANAPQAVARLRRAQEQAAKEEAADGGKGKTSAKTDAELKAATQEVREMIGTLTQDKAKLDNGPGTIATLSAGLATGVADVTGNEDMKGLIRSEQDRTAKQSADLATQMAQLQAVLAGELNVRVVNQPNAATGAPANGRTKSLPVALFDELQRASFGGVEFPTRDVSVHGGIRHKLHEYPHQPSAKIEKLGRKPYEIEMVVPFHNNLIGWPVLYPGGINSIRQLMEDEKTSDLLIPTIGTLPCVLVDITEKMSAKVRSGVEVTLKFIEDTLTTGLEVGVTSTAFVDLASQLADFTIAAEKVTPRPKLFDGITDLTNSISAIRGEVEMAANDVEGKILQCKALIDTADRTLDVLRKPDEIAAPIIEAMRNLWESLDTFERHLQGTGVPLITYVVPRDMTVSDISFDLYQDGTRGAQIMSLNPMRDPFAVRGGTQINVYAE